MKIKIKTGRYNYIFSPLLLFQYYNFVFQSICDLSFGYSWIYRRMLFREKKMRFIGIKKKFWGDYEVNKSLICF